MIEVQSLRRTYGTTLAVDDVSFTIEANTVVGFLGLNGAGKSTTLKVLAGLLMPTDGTVRVDGVDLAEAPVGFRQRIGFLPEEPPLYDEMTVREYLAFLARLRGLPESELDARIAEVARVTQLDHKLEQVIGELSHGYRKRAGIAQAIVHRPRLVILDEPISGLDPVQIVDMRQVIRSLAREATVLISSHNLPEISQVCDRILVLRDGRIVADGTEAELAARFNRANVVALTVRGDRERFDKLMAARPEVRSFEVRREEGGLIDAVVTMEGDDREALVAGIVGAGLGLRRIDDAVDELEEIFIDLNREVAA